MAGDSLDKFRDEQSAYDFIERYVWPDGPVCPRCGSGGRIGLLRGQSTRINTYKCYRCRKPFTVKVGTILEDSKVPLHKWLQAILLASRWQRGINARRVSQILGVTHKTAAAMMQRVRGAEQDAAATSADQGKDNPNGAAPSH